MSSKVKSIPEGYSAITPYLVIKGAAAAIDFYKKAFGATEIMRMPQPDGRIGHAELRIEGSFIMLADEFPEMDHIGPKTLGGTPMSLLLYVENADATFERSVSLGSKVIKPLQDQFYGDRSGFLEDPFGHRWAIATHMEDVSPEEMKRRMASAQK
jgi:PhnB protein